MKKKFKFSYVAPIIGIIGINLAVWCSSNFSTLTTADEWWIEHYKTINNLPMFGIYAPMLISIILTACLLCFLYTKSEKSTKDKITAFFSIGCNVGVISYFALHYAFVVNAVPKDDFVSGVFAMMEPFSLINEKLVVLLPIAYIVLLVGNVAHSIAKKVQFANAPQGKIKGNV